MRWLLTTVLILASLVPASAQEQLPSKPIDAPLAIVVNHEPESFDLIDFRDEQRQPAVVNDGPTHSIFAIKQHLGIAAGYDNGAAHASVGFYLTVAEWGRWNFGMPSFEVGVGRYPAYNRFTAEPFMKDQMAFFVSLASAHYRVGYIPAWGVNWYVNLEQVFDLKANRGGSQLGISFSRK
jgi:hypothetical protein